LYGLCKDCGCIDGGDNNPDVFSACECWFVVHFQNTINKLYFENIINKIHKSYLAYYRCNNNIN
jgi:hypothetical protein